VKNFILRPGECSGFVREKGVLAVPRKRKGPGGFERGDRRFKGRDSSFMRKGRRRTEGTFASEKETHKKGRGKKKKEKTHYGILFGRKF